MNASHTTSSSTCVSAPVVARLLLPDDANPAGNVHGGTILQMMEQAGMIVATRHCNSGETQDFRGKMVAGLARFETMDFHQPIYVGEVASLTANVIFTSERSVLVKVTVTAENAATGTKRVTNSGELWNLSFVSPKHRSGEETDPSIVSVPQVLPPSEEGQTLDEYMRAKSLYEARKEGRRLSESPSEANDDERSNSCLKMNGCLCKTCSAGYKATLSPDDRKPADSQQALCQMVLPGDCGIGGIAFGGFVMKLMDTAAGCCAAKHCRTNVVTVSISSMDFVGFIHLGDIVTINAVATFASAKSLEIAVTASASSFDKENNIVAKGTFTFVSLNKEGRVIPVPRLRLESEEEFQQAYLSQKRYENAKRARLAKDK